MCVQKYYHRLHSRAKNLMDVQDFLKHTYRLAFMNIDKQTKICKGASATFLLKFKIKIRISEGYSSYWGLHAARRKENQI